MPETVPDSVLPQVRDGAVYLPSGHPVEPGSPEFEAVLRKTLPPEMLPDVLTNWRGLSSRITRLQWLAAFLFLLASAALLYYLFPPVVHEKLAPHDGLSIRDLSSSLPFASPYRSLYQKGVSCFECGDYHQLCRIFRPVVEQIVRTRDRDSYALAFLYFKALRKLQDNRSGNNHASGLLAELMQQDPDNPAWAQFYFELSPRIRSMMDYEQMARRLHQDSSWRSMTRLHLHNVDLALKQLDLLRKTTNSGKFSAGELKKYYDDYDLIEVKLLLTRWLLAGTAEGLPVLPDNQYDPGVSERENALRIAMKHENSSCEDFWLVRLFIARTLISQDSLFNHIYWNGEYHTSLDALKHEISICEERLNRRK